MTKGQGPLEGIRGTLETVRELVAAPHQKLDALCEDYPDHTITRDEQCPNGVRFTAQARNLGVHPYAVVAESLGALRDVLEHHPQPGAG